MSGLTGMDRTTGKALSGDAHLTQSLTDIVTTPLGSRVMRRDYGCLVPELIDKPLNRATALLCSVAIAIAIARWEPRVTVRRAVLEGDIAAGQARAVLTYARADDASNALTVLSIPLSRT